MTTAEKTQALVIQGLSDIDVTASAAALAERARLIALAQRGKTIADGASAQRAAEVLKELKAFTRGIEAARKDTKEPVLKLTRDIDALARELTEGVEREASRIASLIGAWQEEQNRIAEEARRKAWEEEQRIKREAEARERAEQERQEKLAEQARREVARQVAEAEAKAARARSEKARAKALAALAEAEAARVKAEQDAEAARKQADAEGLKRDEQTALEIGKAHASAAVVVQAKPQGIAARREVEFEVTDIVALYEACSPLVKLEPNTAAIKAALKQLPEGKTLPGVRHWWKTAAIVR